MLCHGMPRRGILPPFSRSLSVFSFGDGSHGALGQPRVPLVDSYEPSPVDLLPDSVIKIASGHYHSFAITSLGELWSWGRNNENQLGRNSEQPSETWSHPQVVKGLEGVKIKDAVGSGVVSMAIDIDGQLWAWGTSKRGQLGHGEGKTKSQLPQPVQALIGKNVSQVSLGWGHALACTTTGELYSWGYHADGRLGYILEDMNSEEKSNATMIESSNDPKGSGEYANQITMEYTETELLQWMPRYVELGDIKVVAVACGLDHSMVLSDNGLVFTFGNNCYGQLGRTSGTEVMSKEGIVTIEHPVISINAGLGHSLAVALNTDENVNVNACNCLYSWGWNSAFQLGRGSSCDKPMTVPGLVGQKLLAADGGRVHSVTVTTEGNLWTWGSGRNGRLGLGTFGDEEQPCLIESIQDFEVHQAVCGMDHTVILVSKRT